MELDEPPLRPIGDPFEERRVAVDGALEEAGFLRHGVGPLNGHEAPNESYLPLDVLFHAAWGPNGRRGSNIGRIRAATANKR